MKAILVCVYCVFYLALITSYSLYYAKQFTAFPEDCSHKISVEGHESSLSHAIHFNLFFFLPKYPSSTIIAILFSQLSSICLHFSDIDMPITEYGV